MKLLLTSAGIANPTVRDALLELLGRPIAECRALVTPTASYPCAAVPSDRSPKDSGGSLARDRDETE